MDNKIRDRWISEFAKQLPGSFDFGEAQKVWDGCAEHHKPVIEALKCVVQRYETHGSDERSRQGVSLGIYTVCKRALEGLRNEKS